MTQNLRVQYIQFYTGGSAARKLDVAPQKVAPKPRTKKQKRILLHIDPVAILGIAVAAVMVILMAIGCVRLENAQQEAEVMEHYVGTLRRETTELQAEYVSSIDMDAVEKTALGLGMVPQDQVKHVSIRVSVPEEQPAEPSTAWDKVVTILTGLFA